MKNNFRAQPFSKQLITMIAYRSVMLQVAIDLLTDNISLWWLVLLFANDHDEFPASNAYARHGGRKSTADCRKADEDDERKRTRSGGIAREVSSINDENFAHRLVRAGNRWYKYDSNGNVVFEKDLPEGMTLEDDANTVSLSRVQTIRENVYAIDEGWGLFANDTPRTSASGKSRNSGRTYTWNERNQLIATVDDSRSTSYVYDYNGVRTNKYSRGTETLYFNQFYSVRYDNGVGYGNGQVVKHIYLGDTRIVTKLGSLKNDSYSEEYHKQYFYHTDYLGSASLISDFEGREYQRIEYTPYGETWVEMVDPNGVANLPYKFTGKERDEETGLYYFGARYLDSQYSRWMSTDPALGTYLGGSSAGAGGIFNYVNFNLYHYGGNNPIRYTDPTGEYTVDEWQEFAKSSPEEQMAFLKSEYASVQGADSSNLDRGAKSAEMRELRTFMKLGKLFKQDESFMNETLRDFLNLKEDGTMNYELNDIRGDAARMAGWSEVCSIGSQYHQSTAGDNNNLNAKFVNIDGREVVISPEGKVLLNYPDKGTYNYANGKIGSIIPGVGHHNLYDMKPYDSLMNTMGVQTTKKSNNSFRGGLWHGNSHYWGR